MAISIGDLRKKIEASRKYLTDRSLPETWQRNYNYYVGNQWKKMAPDKNPRIVVNICMNYVDSVMAAMLAEAPTAYVVPVTEEMEHQQECESLTGAFAGWSEQTNFQRKLGLGLKNSLIYGSNHYKIFWDSRIGDIAVDAVQPLAFLRDPHATCLEDCEYVIQQTRVSIDRLKRIADYQKAQDGELPSEFRFDEINKPGGAVVYEAWLNGGEDVVWATEDKILAQGVNPYDHGKFPFVRLVDNEVGDQYEGIGIISPIISLQREVNERFSQAVIHARLHTFPWLMYEQGAIRNPNALSNDPDQIIAVQPGMKVWRDWPPPMPAHLNMMPDAAMRAAQNVIGVREVPQGQKPTNVSSGRGLEAVASMQNQRIEGTKARPFERAIQGIAHQAVALMIQHYRGPQIMTYWAGAEMESVQIPEVFQKIPFSIRVEPGTTLAVNRVARMQTATQLAMLGKLADEDLFRALEWPRWREAARNAMAQRMQETVLNEMGVGPMGNVPGVNAPGMPGGNGKMPGGAANQAVGGAGPQMTGGIGQIMRGQGGQ